MQHLRVLFCFSSFLQHHMSYQSNTHVMKCKASKLPAATLLSMARPKLFLRLSIELTQNHLLLLSVCLLAPFLLLHSLCLPILIFKNKLIHEHFKMSDLIFILKIDDRRTNLKLCMPFFVSLLTWRLLYTNQIHF